jgi:hypothetical protein
MTGDLAAVHHQDERWQPRDVEPGGQFPIGIDVDRADREALPLEPGHQRRHLLAGAAPAGAEVQHFPARRRGRRGRQRNQPS